MGDEQPEVKAVHPIQRARFWYAMLLLILGLFAVRLFYLQVIRYDYYKKAALSDQLREYQVPAVRGIISAHMNGATVPIVLNQRLYTLYADPTIVKDTGKVAADLQPIIGGSVSDIKSALSTKDTRYVALAKRLTPDQSAKVLGLKLPGIGTQEQTYRTYPQGTMAAQVLGFVNEDDQGKYGIEQAMNGQLAGTPGQLKAVTDINGVPLAASPENIETQPANGDNVELTLDVGMQAGLEKIVQSWQQKQKSQDVSAIVMDVHTGQIKAMANYPTFDPANYAQVQDASLFNNDAITEAIEPGSITKLFTTATALEKHVITPTTSFYDPGSWTIDSTPVTDVESDHSQGQQTILSVLDKSLNTGATWMLMQLGGGDINAGARGILYDFFTKHFRLGQATGLQQGNGEESAGYVPGPKDNGAAINLTYANMSYGQAYTATALQMVSGLSSILNGGTYYQPTLVDKITTADGKATDVAPKVVENDVVTGTVSQQIIQLMEANNTNHIAEGFPYLNFGPNYSVGGKTGTAQIASPLGGYRNDVVNGTYLGFIGGDSPEYAIVVYNLQPTNYTGFAGANTGQPVFADIAHMLVNDFGVTPKQ